MRLTKRTTIITICLLSSVVFLVWRLVRPMNIFVITEAFERPLDTSRVPAPLKNLRAEECAVCHREFYLEWKSSMHSEAWTAPYFQADWKFEGSQQICRNCHTPLDRQQPQKVLGFRDGEKWDPILASNSQFDKKLQHEGVTCTACHLRDGAIVGVFGDTNAPHPIKKVSSGNEVCMRCHVVESERWDTFFRFPPCGTVAEIQSGQGQVVARSGETLVLDPASLGCVDCHMPLVQRPLADGGKARPVRRHLWRGGHYPEMVKNALDVQVRETSAAKPGEKAFVVALTNIGAGHYLPTGTPDRHLTLELRLLDRESRALKTEQHSLRRTILWRPFIVDLWDTRLRPGRTREYPFAFSIEGKPSPVTLEVIVRYHLLGERRRKRIRYKNKDRISYELYRSRLPIGRPVS